MEGRPRGTPMHVCCVLRLPHWPAEPWDPRPGWDAQGR